MSAVTVALLADVLDPIALGLPVSGRALRSAADAWSKAPVLVQWAALAVLVWRHRDVGVVGRVRELEAYGP